MFLASHCTAPKTAFSTTRLAALVLMASLTLTPAVNAEAASGEQAVDESQPMTLDLSKYFHKTLTRVTEIKEFSHRQLVDGVPFQLEGQISLYGKTPAERGDDFINAALGIKVGRRFGQLDLIHHTRWPDVEGDTVAYICLNYADDTKFMFPIRYGFHVRDWFNLPSYEKETMADPNTRVCWRHASFGYKAPFRLFKSSFTNPFPDKVVVSIDAVSNRTLSSYNILAATVFTPAVSKSTNFVGDRDFDAKITLRVVDAETGDPIKGALIMPSMQVEEQGVVGTPVRTSGDGKGAIPFPSAKTTSVYARITAKGYASEYQSWRAPASGEHTVQLRIAAAARQTRSTGVIRAPALKARPGTTSDILLPAPLTLPARPQAQPSVEPAEEPPALP